MQYSSLEPDILVASTIMWDLLQRFCDYGYATVTGREWPSDQFNSTWATGLWNQTFRGNVVGVRLPVVSFYVT
jgi:hypothetical protein